MSVIGPSFPGSGWYVTLQEATLDDTALSVQVPNVPDPLGVSDMAIVPVGVDGVPAVLSVTVTLQVTCVLTGTVAPGQDPETGAVIVVVVGSREVMEVVFILVPCAGSPW